jgi:hypothetical protein
MAGSQLVRRADIETHVLPDGTSLLFDPVTDTGHVLDALGSLVWDYCDGALNADDITIEVASLLPDKSRLAAEVRPLLADFAVAGLLASAPRSEQLAQEFPTQGRV